MSKELDIELAEAVLQGKFNEIEELLSLGANVNSNAHNLQASPIIIISGANVVGWDEQAKIAQLLIKSGADVNVRHPRSADTPLIIAASQNKLPLVQLLISENADLSLKGKNGRTALHSAAAGGRAKVVQALLNGGANVDMRDESGDTALHKAVCDFVNYEKDKVVATLLNAGADVNALNDIGRSPLFQAIEYNDFNIVTTLLSAGADKNLTDHNGDSILDYVNHYASPKIASIILTDRKPQKRSGLFGSLFSK